MSTTLTMYDLAPSPNSLKVRIALGYKGIPYEKIAVDPADRQAVIELTGQCLTPVITHGPIRLFDSAAIIRYLDANFPDTPSLFSADRATMQAIERWELAGRSELYRPITITFGQFFQDSPDPAQLAEANALLHERTAPIEARLAEGPFLVGETLTAADITCAACIWYAMLPDAGANASPIGRFFREHLRLGEDRERTREWTGRILAYDR